MASTRLTTLLFFILLPSSTMAAWGSSSTSPPPPPPSLFSDPSHYYDDIFVPTIIAVIILSLTSLFIMTTGVKKERKRIEVVLVGCGMPKKSMGWYHLMQLLEMKDQGGEEEKRTRNGAKAQKITNRLPSQLMSWVL